MPAAADEGAPDGPRHHRRRQDRDRAEQDRHRRPEAGGRELPPDPGVRQGNGRAGRADRPGVRAPRREPGRLLMMIQRVIPTPPHEESKSAKMYVARSFDVNQPGIPPEKIVGGVLGGSLMQGHMKVGEEIEISPGRQVTLGNKTEWKNITTTIRS